MRIKQLLIIFSILSALFAQDSIKNDPGNLDAVDKWIQTLGESGDINPTKLPLKMDFGAVEMQKIEEENVWVLTQGVNLWQEKDGKRVLDLYSESAVVWFSGENISLANSQKDKDNKNKNKDKKTKDVQAASFYAEGNVHFFWGNKKLRAEALFFDTQKNKGVLAESVVRGSLEKTPLFLRAQKLLIHSKEHIEGTNVDVSTCQYGEPHYHFSIGHIDITNHNKDPYVVSKDNTLYAGDTPVFYLPCIAGESIENFPLKSIRYGNSSRFGHHLLTTWGGRIYKNSSKESWLKRMDWEFRADIYEERGIGVGPGVSYEGDSFFGLFKTYYVHDQPLDQLGTTLDGDPLDEEEATFEELYRFYYLHRHDLGHGWFLDAELSHISDEELLFDFFEDEAREEKEQETYINIKKVWKNQGVTLLGSANLNDFQNQVVFLPRGTYHLIRQPLFLDSLGGSLYYSSDVEIANVRREDDEDDPSVFDGERIFRFDWINKLNYRFSLGPVHFVPFAEGRFSYFEKGIDDNNIDRGVFTTGIETSTNFYRLFNVRNSFLDVDHLLHVFTPQIRYQFVRTSVDSNELIPFDVVENIDDAQEVSLRLINRFKTIRNKTIRDIFLLEAELSYLPEEGGGFRNQLSNLEIDLLWNIREDWSLRGNAEYNFVFDGIEILSTSFVARPTEKTILGLDVRYERDVNFIFTYSIGYDYSSKWGFELSQQFDFDGEFLRESEFTVRRIFHRFALDVSLEIDNIDDEVGVSFSFIPIDFGKSSTFVK